MYKYKWSLELKLIAKLFPKPGIWMVKAFKIGNEQTLLETCHFNCDVLHGYFKEWNGKYIYFISKIIFYSQIGQMMLIDDFMGAISNSSKECGHMFACIYQNQWRGKNVQTIKWSLHQIGFFSSLNYLNFSLFSKVIGNFPKSNTFSKDISTWYLSDRKEYSKFK